MSSRAAPAAPEEDVLQRFWAVELAPGKDLVLSLTQCELHVTQATAVGDGLVRVLVSTSGVTPAVTVCALGGSGGARTQLLDLSFFPGDEAVTLRVEGACAVALAGSIAVFGGDGDEDEGDAGEETFVPRERIAGGEDEDSEDEDDVDAVEEEAIFGDDDESDEEAEAPAAGAVGKGPKGAAASAPSGAAGADGTAAQGRKRAREDTHVDGVAKPATAAPGDAAAPAAKQQKQPRAQPAANSAAAQASASSSGVAAAAPGAPGQPGAHGALGKSAVASAAKGEAKGAATPGASPAASLPGAPSAAKKQLTGFAALPGSNGLVQFEDKVVGSGPTPKHGSRVTVAYKGSLKDGTVFDQSQSFKFRLGAGEVIKGWDLGVAGMRVGGTRRVILHPDVAYGKRGAPPDIPANATLSFTITLKAV